MALRPLRRRRRSASAPGRAGAAADVSFEIAEIAFDQLGDRAAILNAVPTRLKLEPEQVELVVNAGIEATLGHPVVRRSLGGR